LELNGSKLILQLNYFNEEDIYKQNYRAEDGRLYKMRDDYFKL
jgi:hypothetical protein